MNYSRIIQDTRLQVIIAVINENKNIVSTTIYNIYSLQLSSNLDSVSYPTHGISCETKIFRIIIQIKNHCVIN